jgi:hypothetical protein
MGIAQNGRVEYARMQEQSIIVTIEVKNPRVCRLFALLEAEFPQLSAAETSELLEAAKRILRLAGVSELTGVIPAHEVTGSLGGCALAQPVGAHGSMLSGPPAV